MRRAVRWEAALLALAMCGAACTGSPPSRTRPSGTSAHQAISSSPTTPTASPALIASLPSGCHGGVPTRDASVAFVAGGRAWTVEPDGTVLTCLFKVRDPGPFEWGPRADRVLLGGLQVRGVGSNASRPSLSTQPSLVSWSRPKGLAVAFVDTAGRKLQDALVGGTTIQDVTPFSNVTFQDVLYHPSGLALTFVLKDSGGSAIWISSNRGTDPKRLVWSREGTVFGPLAYRFDGNTLYYGARLANGSRVINAIDLSQSHLINQLWAGKQDVLRLAPSPEGDLIALDTGTGCADRKALLSQMDGKRGEPLLPGAIAPTSVAGWVDETHVLVSEGGCGQPAKLWIVGAQPTVGVWVPASLLVANVDRAAVRVSDPTPPPSLPKIGANGGLG